MEGPFSESWDVSRESQLPPQSRGSWALATVHCEAPPGLQGGWQSGGGHLSGR